MPNLRALAFRHWQEARSAAGVESAPRRVVAAEIDAFWDWSVVELLVQSGLRVEEATELTALDILKRRTKDDRVYYMLHVKPSKYDRARVVPIGDGLGRVVAEIIRHVRDFYGVATVPFLDHWERRVSRGAIERRCSGRDRGGRRLKWRLEMGASSPNHDVHAFQIPT